MHHAFEARDASFDGIFYVGVRTTGIFCRPSCPARTPKPENREYYATAREALFAGFRPCKRCRPLHAGGTPPFWMTRLLELVEADPAQRHTDADLRERGFEPVRVRRYFVKQFGMTFQAFCRGRRMTTAFQQIRKGRKLDDVALGHGYESHSGFREAFSRTFGTPPGRAMSTDCIVAGWIESPIGPLLAGATDDGLCFLEFTDRRALDAQVASLRKQFCRPVVPGDNRYLQQIRGELAEYFDGRRRRFDVPLLYPGSPFQQAVWNALLEIPYGQTRSYESVATAVGAPGACRAVGRTNGQNRLAIVIPCHRVVNKDGRLCGYGGGLWRKQFLLDLERLKT
ncbi:MAG: methylated-DNA--[protein]-cysteine S-methyltransferase [Planctomycetaceae bacterium]|nr:methylated-DNA--[protein]-cysteine S-methyltransferase [Planctomycetaceae bacterium]